MLQSESIKELTGALVKAQASMKAATFNKQNPHFKSKYADMNAVLEAVRKPLLDNGLAVTQTTEMRNGVFCLITRLAHSSGEWIAGEYPLPQGGRPHEVGSAITYAKRYSLSAIAGISSDEDDDGNAAQGAASKPAPATAVAKRENPHVNRPEDFVDFEVRKNSKGELIDCIPIEGHRVPRMKVEDARKAAEVLNYAFDLCQNEAELQDWAENNAEVVAAFSDKWIAMYQGRYQMRLDEFRGKRKAA